MSTQNFIVTITSKAGSRSQVWDTDLPLPLGRPFKWVLERTEDGVRLRELGGDVGKAAGMKSTELTPSLMKKGVTLGGSGKKASVTLSLRPVIQLAAPKKLAKLTADTIFEDKVVHRNDPELATFKKSLQISSLSLVALMLCVSLWPQPKPEEKEIIPPQFAKLVMQQAPKPKGTTETMPVKATSAKSNAKAASNVKNSVVQAFRSQALQSAASSLLKGGMSKLLQQSDFVQGAANSAKTGRMIASTSDALRSTAPNAGMMEAKKMQVAALGGAGDSAGGVGYSNGHKAAVQGQGNSFVKIDVSNSLVDEGLTRDEVGEVIHRHIAEIRYCYEASMLRRPDIQGKLVVAFVIGGPGNVKSVEVKDSTLTDPKLDDCILRRLGSWQFPKPRGGADVAVTYPFIFKSLGG